MKVNNQGTIVWTRIFGKVFVPEKSTDITDIIETGDGDYILTVNHVGQNNANILERIDKDGNLKWTTTFTSPNVRVGLGDVHVKRLRNGELIVATTIVILNGTPKHGFFIVGISEESGLAIWERTIFNIDTLSTRFKSFADVVNITELPNSDLSFISSYADTPYLYFHNTTQVINIITDNIGRLKKVHSYKGTVPTLYASAATALGSGGDQLILMDNADAPLFMYLDATGQIKWKKSYAGMGRSQETRTMFATQQGFYFFSFTHNGGSKDLNLVKTDLQGNASCIEAPLSIIHGNVTSSFKEQSFDLTSDQTQARWYTVSAVSMIDYLIDTVVKCRKTCCTDIVRLAPSIHLCNKSSYTLPNNDLVNASGIYTAVYKTSKGCDSIVFHEVNFSKHPQVDLGPNTCLNKQDSIVIKTVAGQGTYNWMNVQGNSPSFTVKQPGTYWVSVTNGCGTTRDSITVYDRCQFDFYMPNAFTPNGDNNNDHFKIPSLNKNRLIKFTIYNRYGQVVFETTDIKKGWDGTYKNKRQSTGTYVYYIIMETLDQKRVIQKGPFTLIN
jgi:gliding motility-associated-like protein